MPALVVTLALAAQGSVNARLQRGATNAGAQAAWRALEPLLRSGEAYARAVPTTARAQGIL